MANLDILSHKDQLKEPIGAEGRREVWNRLRGEISALEEDGRWIIEEDSLTEPTGDERVDATVLEKVKDDVMQDAEGVQDDQSDGVVQDAAEDVAVTVLEKDTVDDVQDAEGVHDGMRGGVDQSDQTNGVVHDAEDMAGVDAEYMAGIVHERVRLDDGGHEH